MSDIASENDFVRDNEGTANYQRKRGMTRGLVENNKKRKAMDVGEDIVTMIDVTRELDKTITELGSITSLNGYCSIHVDTSSGYLNIT